MSTFRIAHRLISFVLILTVVSGCTTVRTDADGSPCLGFWFGAGEHQHRLVADVLKEHGLSASVDSRGVMIKDDEHIRAMEVMLMDARLKDSKLMMLAMVEAGTGQRTQDGLTARVLLPDEHEDQKE